MSAEKPVVVLVDNNKTYLDTVALFFQQTGMHVVCFLSDLGSNTEDLVDRIQKNSPDIVVTGVRNRIDRDDGDMSGIVLANALKSKGIKVLVTSSPEYQGIAEQNGLPFIGKHLGAPEFVSHIQALIGLSFKS